MTMFPPRHQNFPCIVRPVVPDKFARLSGALHIACGGSSERRFWPIVDGHPCWPVPQDDDLFKRFLRMHITDERPHIAMRDGLYQVTNYALCMMRPELQPSFDKAWLYVRRRNFES